MRALSSLAPLAAVALLVGCSFTEDVPARNTWELAGVLTRSLDLEVVDPATARSLATLVSLSEKDRRANKQDVDDALAAPEVRAVDSLSDTAGRPIYVDVRVILADGRAALVNVERVETDRASEADTLVRDYEFELYRLGKVAVAGSVTVTAAGLSRSLPFSLAP